MSRERTNERFRVAFTICIVLGLIESAWIVAATGQFKGGAAGIAIGVLLWLALGVILGVLQVFPYAFIVLGVAKVREQRKETLETLGDENKVKSDPDGERKLHDYLTAITSTEARIGLLQRSDAYIPPEQRPPEGTKPLRTTLSKFGWSLVSGTLVAGASAGAAIGLYNGLGAGGDKGVGVVQLIVATLFGIVLASPVGVVLALVFGRIDQEEPDDAGRSDQQTT